MTNLEKQIQEYKCKRCKHKGVPILKMGGLICEKCRIILFFPDSLEWKERFNLEKTEQIAGSE